MPRMKKDGEHINAKIDRKTFNMLEEFCKKTYLPKTTVIELAIRNYVSNGTVDANNGLTIPKTLKQQLISDE